MPIKMNPSPENFSHFLPLSRAIQVSKMSILKTSLTITLLLALLTEITPTEQLNTQDQPLQVKRAEGFKVGRFSNFKKAYLGGFPKKKWIQESPQEPPPPLHYDDTELVNPNDNTTNPDSQRKIVIPLETEPNLIDEDNGDTEDDPTRLERDLGNHTNYSPRPRPRPRPRPKPTTTLEPPTDTPDPGPNPTPNPNPNPNSTPNPNPNPNSTPNPNPDSSTVAPTVAPTPIVNCDALSLHSDIEILHKYRLSLSTLKPGDLCIYTEVEEFQNLLNLPNANPWMEIETIYEQTLCDTLNKMMSTGSKQYCNPIELLYCDGSTHHCTCMKDYVMDLDDNRARKCYLKDGTICGGSWEVSSANYVLGLPEISPECEDEMCSVNGNDKEICKENPFGLILVKSGSCSIQKIYSPLYVFGIVIWMKVFTYNF